VRIGIIGAGNMGATLAAQLTRLGHRVAIANSRGPQTLTGVAAQTSATPVPITEVTSNADVVIVAIPEKSIPELPAGLLSSLPGGTVIIDTGITSWSPGTDTSAPSTPACPKANGCKHSYATRWSRRSTPPSTPLICPSTPPVGPWRMRPRGRPPTGAVGPIAHKAEHSHAPEQARRCVKWGAVPAAASVLRSSPRRGRRVASWT
jgi:hypothetical protein